MRNVKTRINHFASFTTEELRRQFLSIANRPEAHVKSGPYQGCVKIRWAKFGDELHAEINRRGETV